MIQCIQSCLMTLILFSVPIIAAADPNYWICSASDGHQTWSSQAAEQRAAINHAYDSCKKASELPKQCLSSRESCEFYLQGKSTRPLWQCTALDPDTKRWKSNFYSKRDDAALAAKAYCKDNSGYPDSCYIVLSSCKNLNEEFI